jgi:hypothetical protein
VPGSQFGVLAHPQPQLVRIGPGATLAGPEFATSMLVAKGQIQSDWVTADLAKAWRVQGLREAPLPAESSAWWGTGKLIEFCTFLPDLSVLYQLVTSVRQSACHWCGIEVIGDRCVFCSATAPVSPAYGNSHAYENSSAYETHENSSGYGSSRALESSPRYQNQLPAGPG